MKNLHKLPQIDINQHIWKNRQKSTKIDKNRQKLTKLTKIGKCTDAIYAIKCRRTPWGGPL